MTKPNNNQEAWEESLKDILDPLYPGDEEEVSEEATLYDNLWLNLHQLIQKVRQETVEEERGRLWREINDIDEIATVNTPAPYDVGEFNLIQKGEVYKLLSPLKDRKDEG